MRGIDEFHLGCRVLIQQLHCSVGCKNKIYVAFSLLLHVVVVGVVGGLWILESVGIWQLGRQAGRPH